MRNKAYQIMLALSIITLFAASGSAFSYDFERSSVLNTAKDSTIVFTQLKPETSYTFKRADGKTIASFETSSTGSASVKWDFSPVADGYKSGLNAKGFKYKIDSSSAQGHTFRLMPGYFIRKFDHFTDSTKNKALTTLTCGQGIKDFSESGTTLEGKCEDDLTFDYKATAYKGQAIKAEDVLFRLTDTQNNFVSDWDVDVVIEGHGTVNLYDGSQNSDIDNFEDFGGAKNLIVRYNQSGDEFVVEHGSTTAKLTGVTSVDNYSIETKVSGIADSGNLEVENDYDAVSIVRSKDRKKWNHSGSFGYEPTAGLLNYKAFDVVLEGSPAIEYAGYFPRGSDSGFTPFLSDIGSWNALATINTENGTADYLVLSVTKASGFDELQPEDERVIKGETQKFSFKWGFEKTPIQFALAVSENGSNYEPVPAKWSSTGECGIDTGVTVRNSIEGIGDFCQGERITAEVDISEYQGKTYWAFSGKQQLEGDKQYNSEVRFFQRLVPLTEVRPIRPSEGVTLTTLKPRFIGYADTGEPGSLELRYDGNGINSWVLRSSTRDRFSYQPGAGLTEGSHTYQYVFNGASGQSASTKKVNFSINTSKANDLNVSLINPINQKTVTTGDNELKYKVEASSSASSSVFLNGEEIDSESINSGTYNYSTDVRNLDSGSYTWFVTVNQSNVIYQSELGEFDVRSNVTLQADRPADSATIDRPPVVFNGTYTSSTSGEIRLKVDGSVRKKTEIDGASSGIYEFVVDKNLSEGKHSYTAVFVTSDGEEFTTETRTFSLKLGTTEAGIIAEGGMLAELAETFIAGPLGITISSAINMISVMVSFAFAMIAAFVSDNFRGQAFGLTFFVTLSVFAIAGLFPVWLPIGVIIIALAFVAFNAWGG